MPSAMWKGIHQVAVTQIDAGGLGSCVILEDSSMKCWGAGSGGFLGGGNSTDRGDNPGEMGDALRLISLGTGRTALQLKVGNAHICVLLDNSQVKCWGNNGFGQLGYGDTNSRGDAAGEMGDSLPFVDLGTGRSVKQISVGFAHTCAILDNSMVKCWGRNSSGALGYGDTDSRGDEPGEMGDALPYVDLGTGRTALQISTNSSHTCALLDNSQVKCWGFGADGILGYGNGTTRGDGPGEMGDALPFVNLGTGRFARQITTGSDFSCALLDNSQVKCWGRGAFGKLGYGDTLNRGDTPAEMGDGLPFVDLGTGRSALKVEAGFFHVCALLDNSQVKCWGDNSNGRLGYGDVNVRGDEVGEMGDALPYVDLGAGRVAQDVVAGSSHTCALLDYSQVKCWGAGGNGKLGSGDLLDRGDAAGEMGDNLAFLNFGRAKSRLLGVREMAIGSNYSCALLLNGRVKCWGQSFGRLGYGDTVTRGNLSGQMGDNLPFVDLGTGRTVRQISSYGGGSHMCALLDNSQIKCWGYNTNGQLGYGDTETRGDAPGEMGDALPFVDLGTGRTARQVAVGGSHTCALLDNSQLKCWGNGAWGALGYSNNATRGDGVGEMGDSLPVVNVGTGRIVRRVAVGNLNTCAILENSQLKCWGHNSTGALGYGDTTNRGLSAATTGDNLPFVDLGAGRTVRAVSVGSNYTCAVLDTSQLKCWGSNASGQLGLGDTTNRGTMSGQMGDDLSAVDLGSGQGVQRISLANSHTCALLINSRIKCWGSGGSGAHGQETNVNLGDGAGEMGETLGLVSLGTSRKVLDTFAGGNTACALLDNSLLKCWGQNSSGELGLGSTGDRGRGPGTMGDNLPVVLLGTKERSP